MLGGCTLYCANSYSHSPMGAHSALQVARAFIRDIRAARLVSRSDGFCSSQGTHACQPKRMHSCPLTLAYMLTDSKSLACRVSLCMAQAARMWPSFASLPRRVRRTAMHLWSSRITSLAASTSTPKVPCTLHACIHACTHSCRVCARD